MLVLRCGSMVIVALYVYSLCVLYLDLAPRNGNPN